MTSQREGLYEQLSKHCKDPEAYTNIFPLDDWTLSEYKEFMEFIHKGWLIQGDDYYKHSNGFIINPEWEGEPMWEEVTQEDQPKKVDIDEAVELFMLNCDDRDERLKAHYREGSVIDGKWVNSKDEEEEEEQYNHYEVLLSRTDDDDEDRCLTDVFHAPKSLTDFYEIKEWIEDNECVSIDEVIQQHRQNAEEMDNKTETGFGTEYHDGSGFDDCDPQGKGNRICKDYPKEKWCSECIYLHNQQQRQNAEEMDINTKFGLMMMAKSVIEERTGTKLSM